MKSGKKIKVLISSVFLCVLAFLLMIVYIPKIAGYKTFFIQTGSMGNEIPKGSLVFVKKIPFEEIAVNDVLTFQNNEGTDYFTHRVIKIDDANKMLQTKGDANPDPDPEETSAYFVVGRVDFSIPKIGYAVQFLNSTAGKIITACVYIAWLAIEIEVIIMKRKASQED